ncbi:hypothetical protein ACIPVK_16240 [Paeniglutamicibacter sp. MACA_103]|uniref:hypothetical protein n=1 Tax=Paeniglutamicibacter sp. MACA_103 TaxID=3377337 RepID=UPI003894D92C
MVAAIVISPTSRIIFSILTGLVLLVGFYAEKEPVWVQGWLPSWFVDFYTLIAALLTVQPLFGGIAAAVTKKKLKQSLREGMDEGLKRIVECIRDIARINTHNGWLPEDARRFERRVVESMQQLMQMTGVDDPRVCLYEIEATDRTQEDAAGRPIVNDLAYVHHYNRDRPTVKFVRTDEEAAGLFEALDTGQHSRQLNRPNYDPEKHHWRSALRVPVEHDVNRWGVLTVDSPKKHGMAEGYEEILGFGAALVVVARLCEEHSDAPTFERLQESLGDFNASGA